MGFFKQKNKSYKKKIRIVSGEKGAEEHEHLSLSQRQTLVRRDLPRQAVKDLRKKKRQEEKVFSSPALEGSRYWAVVRWSGIPE